MVTGHGVTEVREAAAPVCGDFLRTLFFELERAGVRYCVLQRWDALAEEVATDHDIDLAVAASERRKLPAVVGALARAGYLAIQLLNHAVNSYAIIFAWTEGPEVKSTMVDLTFEHRQCGLIWKSGEELIAARQKRGECWVAAPPTEFAYLLLKKTLKDNWTPARSRRFRLMTGRLGKTGAELVIASLFGERRKANIFGACRRGAPGEVLRPLRRRFLCAALARHPVNLLRFAIEDAWRLARRWLRPTGMLIELPEGSEPAAGTAELFAAVFGSVTVREGRPSWLAYWLRIRPRLARTGLVIVRGPAEPSRFGPRPEPMPTSTATEPLDQASRLMVLLARRFRRRHAAWIERNDCEDKPAL